MQSNPVIPKGLIEAFKSDKAVLFYGSRNQGVVCEDTLVEQLGFKVEAFLKSDSYKNIPNRYSQMPTYILSESPFPKEDVYVILTMGRESSEQVYAELVNKGYKDVVLCEDWGIVNSALREIKFDAMMQEHGIMIDKTKDYIQIKEFKFNNPWKEKDNYLSFFLGEFGEIVAPHILDDDSGIMTEGPYCLGDVDIEKNDNVIDLGANIGLFSAAAAAKGCKVFAFEPIDYIAEYLKKTVDLYGDKIEIVNAAASDHDGEISFFEIPDNYHDIGRSTALNPDNKDDFNRVVVNAITIDSFVKERGLSHVDFIKADIEGSERYMLMGAKETLREYAPKLALCTYHIADDKEVMTRLILDANPNYKIIYKWEKLYAYVPR